MRLKRNKIFIKNEVNYFKMSTRKSVKYHGTPSTSPAKTYYKGVKNRRQAAVVSVRGLPTGALAETIRAARSGAYGSLQEVKFFDCSVGNPATTGPYGLITVTGAVGADPAPNFVGITEINNVNQGANSYDRIGTKIVIKSIHLSFIASIGGTTPASSAIRYLLVYDRQPNGGFPLITDILSRNLGTSPIFTTGLNMSNRARFSIIRDSYADISNQDPVMSFSTFAKGRWETDFKANTGAIGDLATGAIYFVCFCAVGGSAVSYVTLTNIQSRIRYYD